MASDGDGRPQPSDGEVLRQAAVYASGVLGMRENPRLQAIAERAATLLKVPMVAISVVDGDRQWMPASIGLDMDETPRDVSFCAHTILAPTSPMVVPDATADERFRNNPLVTGHPEIRFYAGAPIITADGAALGAVCVIDRTPRPGLTAEEEAALSALACEAAAEFEQLDNIRRYGPDAIERILQQMRDAVQHEDETLILELDRILQKVEKRLTSAGNPI